MTPSFNLVEEAWIPCLDLAGEPVELGLRDALVQAHTLREIGGESPLVVAALHRLLLAVLHRVYGPASLDAWYDLWQAGRWPEAKLTDYLENWRDRFDLFHPQRPFYQSASSLVKPKSVNSLVHEFASGNNATLFDHHTDKKEIELMPAHAARLLLAAQSFGLSGLSGLPEKFVSASWVAGVIFLVQGDTLFETLALNLVRYPDPTIFPHFPDDIPTWEMENPFAGNRSTPRGYLDYLTWFNRRILLICEETTRGPRVSRFTVAPGLRMEPNPLDPMKLYRVDGKRGHLALRFVEEKALWRDSSALFSLHRDTRHPPKALEWLAQLIHEAGLERRRTRQVLALGMASDQAKVEFFRFERMPLPTAYLEEQTHVEDLDTALALAEETGRQLWGAARTLAKTLLSPESDQGQGREPLRQDMDSLMGPWGIERIYWSQLELPFYRLLERLPTERETALTEWQNVLRRTAWTAFDSVEQQVGESPRALKATVLARRQLGAGLAKIMPRNEGGGEAREE